MNSTQDIRWIQRFNHFKKAFDQLTKFIEKEDLNKLEQQGLIQSFEYTYELVWNTLKDYFETQGETNIYGSRDAFRLAFRRGLIEDGETWMDMVKSRTLTSYTYNEDVADDIADKIFNRYFPKFQLFRTKMESLNGRNIMTIYFGLKETTIQRICEVFTKYPQVEKAVLYGSRAKGNFKKGSDIDLTLFGGESQTSEVLYRIIEEIDDLLLPYTFDLSIFRQISDADVIDHIRRVGVVFYEKGSVK